MGARPRGLIAHVTRAHDGAAGLLENALLINGE